MRNQLLLLIASLLLLATNSFAQQTITGKITDNNGLPLAGVSIKVKGSSRGAVTNSSGEFSIEASPDDILDITIIGYKQQSIKAGPGTPLAIRLESPARG